ncbi:uncharacterized protein BJ171DRAFT_485830 [Polychytrium aggregatum]|uniref:uncharacterized protein n=1 Tax=Polychytrium aggregatum TaxID=110093 RepID=UPI0022FE6F31|nr:uncharacterized protein BJ171DRAFT_485830 [Polychytrium aggregatum]KAI9209245.1 hypothetical protein BJ171DRAFT_485830 [Polychytrium aggregatum]
MESHFEDLRSLVPARSASNSDSDVSSSDMIAKLQVEIEYLKEAQERITRELRAKEQHLSYYIQKEKFLADQSRLSASQPSLSAASFAPDKLDSRWDGTREGMLGTNPALAHFDGSTQPLSSFANSVFAGVAAPMNALGETSLVHGSNLLVSAQPRPGAPSYPERLPNLSGVPNMSGLSSLSSLSNLSNLSSPGLRNPSLPPSQPGSYIPSPGAAPVGNPFLPPLDLAPHAYVPMDPRPPMASLFVPPSSSTSNYSQMPYTNSQLVAQPLSASASMVAPSHPLPPQSLQQSQPAPNFIGAAPASAISQPSKSWAGLPTTTTPLPSRSNPPPYTSLSLFSESAGLSPETSSSTVVTPDSSKRSKKAVAEFDGVCRLCSRMFATMYIHDIVGLESHSGSCRLEILCLSCEDHLRASDSGYSRESHGYFELECHVCKRDVGAGKVEVLESAQLHPRKLGRSGRKLSVSPNTGLGQSYRDVITDTEVICTSCSTKYRICTDCGAGGKWRTGKWRPTELFADGRRTCKLQHLRTGDVPVVDYRMFSLPLSAECGIANDKMEEFVDEVLSVMTNGAISRLAAPPILEYSPCYKTFADLHKRLNVITTELRDSLDPTKPLVEGIRYMLLGTCSTTQPKKSKRNGAPNKENFTLEDGSSQHAGPSRIKLPTSQGGAKPQRDWRIVVFQIFQYNYASQTIFVSYGEDLRPDNNFIIPFSEMFAPLTAFIQTDTAHRGLRPPRYLYTLTQDAHRKPAQQEGPWVQQLKRYGFMLLSDFISMAQLRGEVVDPQWFVDPYGPKETYPEFTCYVAEVDRFLQSVMKVAKRPMAI